MPYRLRILHLSDLHARGARDGKRAYKREQVLGESWRRNLDELTEDGRTFDLVVVTGDIADSGAAEEYAAATTFFMSMLDHLRVSPERLFVVPGNHDIYRKTGQHAWEMLREGIRTRECEVSEWLAGTRDEAPFGFDPAWRDSVFQRQDAFWAWVERELGRGELLPARSRHGRLGYSVPVTGLPSHVQVIGLNSAWLAGDDADGSRLFLTEDQLGLLCLDPKGRPWPGFRVALIHHPLSDLADHRSARQLLGDNVDLLLRGHQHNPIAHTWTDPDRTMYELVAGCLFEDSYCSRHPNCFNVIDVVLDAQGRPLQYEIRFRTWSPNGHWHDDGALYREAKHGRLIWFVRSRANAQFVPTQLTEGSPESTASNTSETMLPTLNWQDLPADADLFAILSWRCRLVPRLVGRSTEEKSLREWALSSQARARLLWLSGPGGVGKSRLAAELCAVLREEGWSAGFVSWSEEITLPAMAPGVCLVFDYPEEHRTKALEWIRKLASLPERGSPVRALLLSRQGMDAWEDEVKAAHAWHLCAGYAIPSLALLQLEECVQLFQEASKRFADRYGHSSPLLQPESIRAWYQADPTIHGLPLFIAAAAIHAVLEPARPLALGGGAVMRVLAEREAARLNGLSNSLGMEARAPARLCALAAVRGGLDSRCLRRMAKPELGLGLPLPNKIVDAVSTLPWWCSGALQAPVPDLLAAALLHHVLRREADSERIAAWLWAVLEGIDKSAIDRLGKLCYDFDLVTRGTDALPLAEHLAYMVDHEHDKSIARAWELAFLTQENVLPYGLNGLALAVGHAIAADLSRKSQLEPERFRPQLAGCLRNLAVLLSQAGRRGEALHAAQLAVGLLHELIARDSSSLPELALGLNNLSSILGDAGHHHDAVAIGRDAVAQYRKLAQDDPRQFLQLLALSLDNLGDRFAAAGHNAAGLQCNQESVELYRKLACHDPDRFRLDLAIGLNNLSNRLGEVGRTEEGLQAAMQAVEIFRELYEGNRARFLLHLATGLNNLGNKLHDVGQLEEALKAMEEAITYRSFLADRDPERFLPQLATSLNNRSLILRALGRLDESLAAIRAAVGIRRRLTNEHPRFRGELARSLGNLALTLKQAGCWDEAIGARREEVTLFRELASEVPERFRKDLAASLYELAKQLTGVDHDREAMESLGEAVALLRVLTEEDPTCFRPSLADCLVALALRCHKLEKDDEALIALNEAISIYCELAENQDVRFLKALAMTLNNKAILLGHTGHLADSIKSIQEAIALSRRGIIDGSPHFRHDLAKFLTVLANRLRDAKQWHEATDARKEAIGHYRKLIDSIAEDLRPELAACLNNLGIELSMSGSLNEAIEASEESVALRRLLAEENSQRFLPDLAASLQNLAINLSRANRKDEAIQIAQETIELCQRLNLDNPFMSQEGARTADWESESSESQS